MSGQVWYSTMSGEGVVSFCRDKVKLKTLEDKVERERG